MRHGTEATLAPVVERESAEKLLEASGLTRGFDMSGRRVEVLSGASFTIAPGEVVAIVGRSGVGKSTLLHVLGALDRPDSGSLHYRGTDVLAASEAARARFRSREVGFVFQFHHLLPEFTALENVMMPAKILRRSPGEAAALARDMLVEVGLGDRMEHRPAQLSGGEQQRVAIARALVNRPALLLADEPSGDLDPATGEMIYDLLFDLRTSLGQAIVVATHSPELAARADRTLELSDGRLHDVLRHDVGSTRASHPPEREEDA
jgi:lipoprotein-releasing system ATP-binding protein